MENFQNLKTLMMTQMPYLHNICIIIYLFINLFIYYIDSGKDLHIGECGPRPKAGGKADG